MTRYKMARNMKTSSHRVCYMTGELPFKCPEIQVINFLYQRKKLIIVEKSEENVIKHFK